ncbi:hypothetical protein D3C81_355160 [compost metagenome]
MGGDRRLGFYGLRFLYLGGATGLVLWLHRLRLEPHLLRGLQQLLLLGKEGCAGLIVAGSWLIFLHSQERRCRRLGYGRGRAGRRRGLMRGWLSP